MCNLSQLKICFLAGTLEHGGAERQLFYMLQALRHAGAATRVLSLDQGEFWEKTIKALGVSVTCVGDRPSRMARLFRVLNEVRRDCPDALQSQHFYANAYAGLAARLLRISGIGAMRNDGRSEMNESGRLGGRLNLRLPGMLAANSQIAIQYARSRGIPPSRLHFLPNVVDTEWFKSFEAPAREPFTLIAVGRLVKQKRLDRFISAVSRLRAEFGLNVRGLIVGPGCRNENLRMELEDQAKCLGLLPDIVQFLGSASDIRSHYHQAAVCVLTSDWEGTPNVLLEAMACGLPVVATNVGGVQGIVRHGQTGFLLEPNDLEGLVSALAELAKNSELRIKLGRQARAHVEDNFSLHRLPAYLDDLYERALPRARRSMP